jgi:hypothetical protein
VPTTRNLNTSVTEKKSGRLFSVISIAVARPRLNEAHRFREHLTCLFIGHDFLKLRAELCLTRTLRLGSLQRAPWSFHEVLDIPAQSARGHALLQHVWCQESQVDEPAAPLPTVAGGATGWYTDQVSVAGEDIVRVRPEDTTKRAVSTEYAEQAPHRHRGQRVLVGGTERLSHPDPAPGRMQVGDLRHGQQVADRPSGRAR